MTDNSRRAAVAGALSRRLVAMATRYRLGATSGTSRYRVFTRSSGVDWEPTCARALGGRWAKLEDLLSRVSLAVSGPPFRLASPTPGRTCVNRHSAGGGSVQQRCGICSTCPGRIGRMLHSVSDDSLSSPYAIALEALESNARMPLDEHVEELPRRSESLGSHGSPLSRGSAAALGRLAGGSGRSVSSSRACRVRSTVRPSTADQGLPLGAPQIVVSAGGGARSRLHRVTSLTGRDVELAAHAFRGSGEPRTPLREALATVAGGGHRDGYRCRRRALWCPPLRAVPPRRPPAAGIPVAAPGPGAGRGRPTRRCRWVGFSQQNASPAEQLGAQSRGGPYSQST